MDIPQELLSSSLIYMLSFALLLLLFTIKYFTSNDTKKRPPSPPKLPLIGNLHQLSGNAHRAFNALSLKYGPLMLLHFGQVPAIIVSSAKFAQEILKTNDQTVSSRPAIRHAELVTYGYKGFAFAPYNDQWRNLRKISTIHLLSSKRVQSYDSMRDAEVVNLVEKIRETSLSSPDGRVNLTEKLYDFANGVVCRITTGKFDKGGRHEMLKKIILANMDIVGEFNFEDIFPRLGLWLGSTALSSPSRKTVRNVARFDALMNGVIKEHEARDLKEGEEDFVDVLLSLQKGKEIDFELTKENMKAIIVEMLVAGTETSYATLVWAMTELIRNPEKMKKLKDEINKIPLINGKLDADRINKLPYLNAVIKETLRLYPPAPLLVPRESVGNCTVQDYNIHKGDRVFINVWAIGRDPERWESPNEFKPERFIESDIDFRGKHFDLLPFGAGRRICPGMQFAVANLENAIANLMHKFDWELPPGVKREEMDMSEGANFSLCRKEKLILIAKPCAF
ncbi:hypothetical protein LUZ60_013708 [Juncus effusus]|nr:hypothetical protein LUZ60_013708 [Juncus effusus]